MSARADLEAIYAADPLAKSVQLGAGATRRRTRGFLRVEIVMQQDGQGLQVPVRQTTLKVIAGALGEPAADTRLTVDGVRYRLLAELVPHGRGDEELALLARESV